MKLFKQAQKLVLILMIVPQLAFTSEIPDEMAKKYLDIWKLDPTSGISAERFTARVLAADAGLAELERELANGVRVEDLSEKYFWRYQGASALAGIVASMTLNAGVARTRAHARALDWSRENGAIVHVEDSVDRFGNKTFRFEPVKDQVRFELRSFLKANDPNTNYETLTPEARYEKLHWAHRELYANELAPLKHSKWVTRSLYGAAVAASLASIYWLSKTWFSDQREITLTDEEKETMQTFATVARAKINELKLSPKFQPLTN